MPQRFACLARDLGLPSRFRCSSPRILMAIPSAGTTQRWISLANSRRSPVLDQVLLPLRRKFSSQRRSFKYFWTRCNSRMQPSLGVANRGLAKERVGLLEPLKLLLSVARLFQERFPSRHLPLTPLFGPANGMSKQRRPVSATSVCFARISLNSWEIH